MEPTNSDLEAFFRATEAPPNDEDFVWRALEAYGKRSRLQLLLRTAGSAAVAGLLVIAVVSAISNLDTARQLAVAGSIQSLLAYGALAAAVAHAGRLLRSNGGLGVAHF